MGQPFHRYRSSKRSTHMESGDDRESRRFSFCDRVNETRIRYHVLGRLRGIEPHRGERNCGIYYSCIVLSNLFSAFPFHVEDLRD